MAKKRIPQSSATSASAADLSRTNAEYLLENPPRASTPELQAKQERLLRMLVGSPSTTPRINSTESDPSELKKPTEMLDPNDPLHAVLESLTPEQMLRMFPSKTVKPLSASTDQGEDDPELGAMRIARMKHQNAEYRRLSKKS